MGPDNTDAQEQANPPVLNLYSHVQPRPQTGQPDILVEHPHYKILDSRTPMRPPMKDWGRPNLCLKPKPRSL